MIQDAFSKLASFQPGPLNDCFANNFNVIPVMIMVKTNHVEHGSLREGGHGREQKNEVRNRGCFYQKAAVQVRVLS